jgi:hypothetical protein
MTSPVTGSIISLPVFVMLMSFETEGVTCMGRENKRSYDAVLIPGGGLTDAGELPPWVVNRLERALAYGSADFFITLSGGTCHKPPPLDERGFPRFESVVAARYLLDHGVAREKLLYETASYDTLGNAFFARTQHLEPRRLRSLLVITSGFHMARTRAMFAFVCGLTPHAVDFQLEFEAVPDVGLDPEVLAARNAREAASLESFLQRSKSVTNMAQLHHWLFAQHSAYSIDAGGEAPDPQALQSY